MKVAVALTDQSFTRTKSMGIFNVSMGLVRGLMRHPDITELHILGNNECGGEFPNLPPHVHLHLADKPVPRRFGRVWWDQFGLSAVVRKIAPDWLILPKGVPPLFPMLGKTKLACYVHAVMWEHYEQRPIGDRPKAFPLHEFIYFKNLSLHAMRIADVVLTHTQFNADLIRHYVPQARIYRIGIGFDSPASPRNADEATDILTYGSTFPHKRLDLTLSRITAWLNQRPDGNNIRVHIVGSLPKDCILPDERWIHHKRIPYPELCRLMQEKCRMAVYFSDYESYGMPPVECLLNGVPCLSSDIPPIRENIPEQYLVPNENEEAFIRTAEDIYNQKIPLITPPFPSWERVTNDCVRALKQSQ